MMLNTTTASATALAEAAGRLRNAAATRIPCPPVRDLIGSDDVAAAYAVQRLVAEARLADGGVIVGRKIGLTSEAVQHQLSVSQPDFGLLFADMQYDAAEPLPLGRLLQPKVEAEIAFVLGDDLVDGDLDDDQVSAAVAEVAAALEICDSRIADWNITFGDTVADNASAGAFVLGSERWTLNEVTPREVTMTMTVTGQPDSTGTGAACLGDPLLALQWLARQARELGDPLLAGQVVLSGALGPMRPVAPGAEVRLISSELGGISVRFEEEF
jgi:2-keto-4-pentenoate hydratase